LTGSAFAGISDFVLAEADRLGTTTESPAFGTELAGGDLVLVDFTGVVDRGVLAAVGLLAVVFLPMPLDAAGDEVFGDGDFLAVLVRPDAAPVGLFAVFFFAVVGRAFAGFFTAGALCCSTAAASLAAVDRRAVLAWVRDAVFLVVVFFAT
jgi:hypothetical protein